MANNPIIPPTPAATGRGVTDTAESARSRSDPGVTAASKPERLQGLTTIDDKVFLECEMLAYASIEIIAGKIAAEMEAVTRPATDIGPVTVAETRAIATGPRLVILVDDELLAALRLFASLKLQLSLFEKGFGGVAATPTETPRMAFAAPALALAGVTAAVEGVVDLLGLFRQDTQFSGRAVSIQETALYLELAHALRAKSFEVRYPRLLTYKASVDPQPSQTILTKLFERVFDARKQAVQRLRPLLQTVATLERDILERRREFEKADATRESTLTVEIQKLEAQLADARKNLDPDLVLFENTDTQWNELQKGLSRADQASALTPMQVVARAADVLALFTPASAAYICYAKAIVAGGTMRIRRNLLQTIFHGETLEFSGGAVVSYALFDPTARVLVARTHRHLMPFRGFMEDPVAWTSVDT
jgi:hypothetical protein